MNYKILKKSFLFSALFLLLSCEEIIILDLDTEDQKLVIQADLNVTDNTCTVLINKSSDFYASNDFEKVAGASISLTTSSGNIYILNEVSEGKYSGSNILTIPDETVSIEIITVDNQAFMASAIVPKAVELDKLLVEESPSGGGLGGGGGNVEKQFELTLEWQDIAGEANFYRAKIFKNEAFLSGVYVLADDVLGDGVTLTRPVIREFFDLGDEIRVQLLSINKGYYDYFSDIANSDGRGFSSPTPYNPGSNLDNNALGYFGIWQMSEKMITVE